MYKSVFVLLITSSMLIGCAAKKPTKPLGPSRDAETPLAQAFCEGLFEGLPKVDPMFELKGKVTTNSAYNSYSHEISQFGRPGVYHEYFVGSSVVPNLYNRFECGDFPLYQLSKAEYLADSQTYKITLKNGKTYTTTTNIPFSVRDPDKQNRYTKLVGGKDKQKLSWFWYLVNDPRFKEPREIEMKPTDIGILEIY